MLYHVTIANKLSFGCIMDLTTEWRDKRKSIHHRGRRYRPISFPEDPRKSGCIYLIICKPSRRAYVGQTRYEKERMYSHKNLLRKGSHHSIALQKEWDEHGEDSFLFTVVERRVDLLFLYCREQFWIWRFEGRILNSSCHARPSASRAFMLGGLKRYSDDELIGELRRRGLRILEESSDYHKNRGR